VSYDGEKAGGETGDEIFASSSADDGVVGAGDGGAVISGHHQAHLDELAGVPRQPGKGGGVVVLNGLSRVCLPQRPRPEADLLWNQRSPRVPPRPISDLKTSVMGMPA